MNYHQQALVGATGVELIVGLYDAALRSLYRAKQAVEEDDVHGRRLAVHKVTEIIMHLQAHLRADVGGAPAMALSDFYAAMFAMTLEASHAASPEAFDEVIWSVRNVRDAWVIVAKDPEAGKVLSRDLRTREEDFVPAAVTQRVAPGYGDGEGAKSRWSA
jgi:flagellar protein FliS